MVKKYPTLARGESALSTGRKHIPTWLFKETANLSKQLALINAEIASINPINSGKKKDNILDMLNKWFPKMEKLQSQMKKYQHTIDLLEKENAELEIKAKEGNENKIKNQLEYGKMQVELREMSKFVDLIPNDLMEELKSMQKQQKSDRGREI